MPELAAWENFYVIVGSSSAALTGLMFVVIALINDTDMPRSRGAVSAYGTPTVVHFCVGLVVSAALSAPWHSLAHVAWAVGVCGAAGAVYVFITLRRARRQTEYAPVFEDWLWHTGFPMAAYIVIVIAAVSLAGAPEPSLFAVGTAVLSLVLIGIHNAWDTVTYITFDSPTPPEPPKS